VAALNCEPIGNAGETKRTRKDSFGVAALEVYFGVAARRESRRTSHRLGWVRGFWSDGALAAA